MSAKAREHWISGLKVDVESHFAFSSDQKALSET